MSRSSSTGSFNNEDNPFDFAGRLNKFSDPFLLPSNDAIPRTLEHALDLCLFMYYMNPQYRRASSRVVSHFITELDFPGDGDNSEKEELYDYLREHLDLFGALLKVGNEWACYGNGFLRIHFPFDRFLIDRRSGKTVNYSLDMFGENAKYDWSTMTYEVDDPVADSSAKGKKKKVKLPFLDRRSMDLNRIKLRCQDPRFTTIQHSWVSGKSRFIWRFEPWFLSQIKKGEAYQVNETPIAMLAAIKDNQDFLFNEDEIYHLKAPTIMGISNNGWGIPEIFANYRSLHQLQVYRKIDEAVGLDYMLPFRMFSPNMGNNVTDATMHMLLGQWSGHMEEVIRRRRLDMTSMHAVPFPVNYQEFGAQGKSLTPKDLIEFQTNDMLDGMGYPAELFRGSLTVQQVPTAIRLFENSFHFLHYGMDGICKWAVRRIRDYMNQERMDVQLQLPSLADDIEKRQIYLQLAAGGEISRQKAYRSFGVDDPIAEAEQRMEEDIEIQRVREKKQLDYERERTMGSADDIIAAQSQQNPQQGSAPGGAAGMAPGSTPTTPLDVQQQADQIAQELIAIPSNGERTKQLNQIKASNPTLHAMVKQKMEEIRAQGASQGRAQVQQQIQQGGAQQQ
jgi:hypothetical protein